jgi:hypothetical protein
MVSTFSRALTRKVFSDNQRLRYVVMVVVGVRGGGYANSAQLNHLIVRRVLLAANHFPSKGGYYVG